MNGIKQFRKNKQGFLLIDAIVGVLIMAIGLTALALLYMQGTDSGIKADKFQAAVQVAGQEMERLKKADRKSLAEAEEIIAQNQIHGNGNINHDDDKYVAMRGYTPKAEGGAVTEQERFVITTSLMTNKPVGSEASGELSNYPVSVKVTWYDPEQSSYTVYGYIMVQND